MIRRRQGSGGQERGKARRDRGFGCIGAALPRSYVRPVASQTLRQAQGDRPGGRQRLRFLDKSRNAAGSRCMTGLGVTDGEEKMATRPPREMW